MAESGSDPDTEALPLEALPFGSWPSPISAALVAAGGVKLEGVGVSGEDVWWQEIRPAEQGRSVLVSSDGGDRLAPPWSARSRVHEYGGGAWWLGHRHAYFVEAGDQAVYRMAIDGPTMFETAVESSPERLSAPAPEGREWRFADGREHPDGSLVVCVRESHDLGASDHAEPTNELIAISVAPDSNGQPVVLVSGPDFVSDPRISPDGRHLSWIQWNHPNMPWNETALLVAPLRHEGGTASLGPTEIVTSGVSVCGADWTSDGRLVYSNDAGGRWNLHWWRIDGTRGATTGLSNGEIGAPSWTFGVRRWVELTDGRLAAVVTRDAVDELVVVELDGAVRSVPGFGSGTDFGPDTLVSVGSITAAGKSAPADMVVIGATPTSLPNIIRINVDSGLTTVIRPAAEVAVGAEWLSIPDSIWFDSRGRSTHAFFYPPAAASTDGTGDKPPLIVIGHGGPTAHNGPELSLKIQYWTSRGFAVVDVNYGGSTGFGKKYRDRLHGTWGGVDVDDCIDAALHLAAEGLVDGDRLAIRGSSSGGLTVLAALIKSDRFAAGVSLYGVADLKSLAADTHKFESRYLDWLIGPYPDEIDIYESRSPVNNAEAITTPMLLMQGTEDKVVPPSQSEAVVAALAANGVDHVYVTFDGESHGFRRAESIASSLELELWFYGHVFGFVPADDVSAPGHAVGRGFDLDVTSRVT